MTELEAALEKVALYERAFSKIELMHAAGYSSLAEAVVAIEYARWDAKRIEGRFLRERGHSVEDIRTLLGPSAI